MLTLLLVNHTDVGTSFLELLGNALPDTLRTTSHNGYFVFENHNKLFDNSLYVGYHVLMRLIRL